jgi:hypothetical protein
VWLAAHGVVEAGRVGHNPSTQPSADSTAKRPVSDEELIQTFYDCWDTAALRTLAERYHALLAREVYLVLVARSGNPVQARDEWFIDEAVQDVWTHVYLGLSSFEVGRRWNPRKGSVLAWLLWLTARTVDRHLGYYP